MYADLNQLDVTISPRIANGHSEPSFADTIDLETLPGTEIKDDMFVVKAVCHFCRAWLGGSLDVTNTAHPMIYAFGPGQKLESSSLDASLKRHIRYGQFTMDLVHATGKGAVPEPKSELDGVFLRGDMVRDHDRANLAHAVVGCLALFLLWPMNIVVAGFFKRIGIHMGVSAFILVFLVISYGLGIATSYEYNRVSSKSFQGFRPVC
jgi:hypothetical protein